MFNRVEQSEKGCAVNQKPCGADGCALTKSTTSKNIWLDSSLIYQVWSAWWIRGAGEYRPHCDEIHLHTVFYRLLCTSHGSDRLGSDDKPSQTRRSLIPALSWSESKKRRVLLFRKLKTARVHVLFCFFFSRRHNTSGIHWFTTWKEHMRFLTVCRVSPANQWKEERLCSRNCIFHLKPFRKLRLKFSLI